MRHLAFLGSYINAPSSDDIIRNSLLCEVIKYMGKKYGSGRGSSFAKGKRYLKSKIPGCSTRNIKLMLNSVPNVLVASSVDYKYVFRFSKSFYVLILAEVIKLMMDNKPVFHDDIVVEYAKIRETVIKPSQSYSELLIREPLISLNTVCLHGHDESVRNLASSIKDGITKADGRYSL